MKNFTQTHFHQVMICIVYFPDLEKEVNLEQT